MTATVKEIMNPELFCVRPSDSSQSALDGILALGITGAAVTDPAGKPVGVVSLRDLAEAKAGSVGDKMSSPAVVVREEGRLETAARLIAETGYRRLVVVNREGRAVGMVSAIDVLRGLLGLPARHPGSFPHLDAKTGLTWTDDAIFDADHVEGAPQGPGILMLVHDEPGMPRRIVWVESTHDLKTRLLDLLSAPQESVELRHLLERPQHLRFRAAAVSDPKRREALLKALPPPMGPPLNPKAHV